MKRLSLIVVLLGLAAMTAAARKFPHFDLTQPLSEDIIYARDLRIGNEALQSFDLTRNGDLILGATNGTDLIFQRSTRDGHNQRRMVIRYGGHCTNMAIEETRKDVYIWTSNYASSLGEAGPYFQEQIISRVRYEPGRDLMPWDCDDNYYLGPRTNVLVATDPEHDLIAFFFGDRSKPGFESKVEVYSLKAVRRAPVRTVTLQPLRWHGGEGRPLAETRVFAPEVTAHDLTQIQPLHAFWVDNGAISGGEPMQGFCIYKDRMFWFACGNCSSMVSTILFDGTVTSCCAPVALDDSQVEVRDFFQMVPSAYFEGEGIKVRKGRLYLGYFWRRKYDGFRENHNSIIRL